MRHTALAPLSTLALPPARRWPGLADPGREARLLGGSDDADAVHVRPRRPVGAANKRAGAPRV